MALSTLINLPTADVGDRDAHHIAGNCRTENFMAVTLQDYQIGEPVSVFPDPLQTDPHECLLYCRYWQPRLFRQSQYAMPHPFRKTQLHPPYPMTRFEQLV